MLFNRVSNPFQATLPRVAFFLPAVYPHSPYPLPATSLSGSLYRRQSGIPGSAKEGTAGKQCNYLENHRILRRG